MLAPQRDWSHASGCGRGGWPCRQRPLIFCPPGSTDVSISLLSAQWVGALRLHGHTGTVLGRCLRARARCVENRTTAPCAIQSFKFEILVTSTAKRGHPRPQRDEERISLDDPSTLSSSARSPGRDSCRSGFPRSFGAGAATTSVRTASRSEGAATLTLTTANPSGPEGKTEGGRHDDS